MSCALLLTCAIRAHAGTPVAASFSTAVPVTAQSVIQLQGSDDDGTPLTYATTTAPAHGVLSNLNTATGALVYTPAAGYTGSDSFNYTVTSGGDTSGAGTVTIAVTAAKTRVIDTLTNPDGTPRRGKVSFFLTQVASSPSDLIPAKASVSAQLNSSGQFDVSLFPSRAVNPVQFYQVWHDDMGGRTQFLGLYDIPASTTTITLAGHRITEANLAAQYVFASKAEVDALTAAVAAATTVQFFPSLTAGRHVLWNGSGFANSIVSESGTTMTITGNLNVMGNQAVTGNQTVGGSQNVTGTSTVATSAVTGNQTVGGNLSVTGTITGSGTGVTQADAAKLRARTVSSSAPSNGQVLGWNSTTSQWEPQAAGATVSGGNATQLQGRAVSAATPSDGQALVYSTSAGAWGPAGVNFFFSVKAYGAVGNGTTDDTSAINAAIAAVNAVGRGTLFFPAGDYRSASCNFTTTTFTGRVIGEGRGDANAPSAGTYGTRVKCESATAKTFTSHSSYLRFEDLVLTNTAATTPTSGSTGIYVDHGSNAYAKVDYLHVAVEKFYINIDVRVGDDWRMDNCWIASPQSIGVRINNTTNPDTGGWAVVNSAMVSTVITAVAVKVESCGGAKIVATNILGYAQAVVVDNTNGSTSVLLITGCSFENLHGTAIDINTTNPGQRWQLVTITGCEFGYYESDSPATTANAIKLTNVDRSVVTGNTFRGFLNTSQVAVLLTNCTGIRVTGNQTAGFARELGFLGTYSASTQQGATYRQMTLVNGWSALAGTWHLPGYNYIDGQVKLVGGISSGTADSIITNIPVGYRIGADQMFTVASNTGTCQVLVKTNGDVVQRGAGGSSGFTISGCSNASLWLDGISYVPYATVGP